MLLCCQIPVSGQCQNPWTQHEFFQPIREQIYLERKRMKRERKKIIKARTKETKEHHYHPQQQTFLLFFCSITALLLSISIYFIFTSSFSSSTNIDATVKSIPPSKFIPIPVPFVPCHCSVPTANTKRKSADLGCAVVIANGTKSGTTSLSIKPMVVDGLQTIQKYVTLQEQRDILLELQQFPFVEYAGKTCQEFGQNFSFYVDKSTDNKLPPAVKALGDRLVEDGILTKEERPNYVLVNRYTAGQGIHAHVDDNYYTDGIVSVTLMSGGSLNFFRDKSNIYFKEHPEMNKKYVNDSLLECGAGYFEPGSLFAMHREGRYAYKHEMQRRYTDRMVYAKQTKKGTMKVFKVRNIKRKERIAITFRHVKQSVIDVKNTGGDVDASSAYGGRI